MQPLQPLLRIIVLIAFVALAVSSLSAQTRNRLDNRGHKFYAAFLPTDGYDNFPQFSVTVWCEVPTRGVITYMRDGTTIPVNIPAANTPVRVLLDQDRLIMADDGSAIFNNNSIRAEFQDEVTLYGMNTERWSSDSFFGIPEDAIGKDYRVLSYPNTSSASPINRQSNRPDFPSQFAVVATQNQTSVTIRPTVRIRGRVGTAPFTITLNEGQVFLAQSSGPVGEDLTGTGVTTDKPVVVYGSHQRTNVPFTQSDGRDHIVDQMWPANLWGRRIFLTPHYQLPKTVPDQNLARIVAAFDNTDVTIDSVPARTLQQNEYMEILLDRAKIVTANKPVLCAQYQHSSVEDRFLRIENDSIGDPFMALVQPPEYFDSIYVFESFDTPDFPTGNERRFYYHFANVTIPMERVSSLLLDGNPVSESFVRIANTSYGYAQLRLQAGTHKLTAKAPFGLMIYGYGPYNSYGHPGGAVFDTLFKDQKPPNLMFADTCNGITGLALDDSVSDFGIESVRLETSSFNVTMRVDPFKKGQDSVRFRLQLRDPFSDGRADVTVIDTAGLDHRYSVPVKGFTVDMSTPRTVIDTLASLNGFLFCRSITLSNYGAYPQTISSINAAPNVAGFSITTPLPFVLAPGESRDVEFCFKHVGDTAFNVALSLGNGCLERPLTILPLVSGIDSLQPSITLQKDSCSADRTYMLSEVGALSSGIKTIDTLTLVNAQIELTPPTLPSAQVRLRIIRSDPRQDMSYHIRITDRVGNVIEISDTIQGFTLLAETLSRTQVGLRVDRPFNYSVIVFGRKECDSIYLNNYGMFPIVLDNNIRLLVNTQYSIPPSQFPITIPPGQRRGLYACIKPTALGDQVDTLVIDYFCNTISELVQFATPVDPMNGVGSDKCQNVLRFLIGGFTKRNFVEGPVPNPVTSSEPAHITIGVRRQQFVRLSVMDMFGRPVMTVFEDPQIESGISRIDFSTEGLPAGSYFVQMQTEDDAPMYQRLVVTK